MSLLRPLVRRIRHGMTLGVRVIATDPAERLLLVKHTYVSGWHLPGGGVDVGESAVAAAARELHEEANVTLTDPLALRGVYFNPKVGGRDHVLLFHATHVAAGPRPQPGLEILAAEFFAPDTLPEEISPATARRIAEWRDGVPPVDLW